MTIHHRMLRPFALTLSLLLAPALSAAAQNEEAAPSAQAAQANASGAVNINTASAEEFSRLPGIGPSRAQAIIDLRTRLKGFKSVEDLMRVRGIGRKTFRKLQPMLKLQGDTTLVEARRPRAAAQR
jgi:competence protein ComEA